MPTITALANRYAAKFKSKKYIEGAEKLTRISIDTTTGIPVFEFIPEVVQALRDPPPPPTTKEEKEFALSNASLIVEPQKTILINTAKEITKEAKAKADAAALEEARPAIEDLQTTAEALTGVVKVVAKPVLIFAPKILPRANPNAPSTP